MINKLVVQIPSTRVPENTWIVNTLLSTYLGLDIDMQCHSESSVVIKYLDHDGTITIPSVLLTEHVSDWSAETAVPTRAPWWINQHTLPWDVPQPNAAIPVLYVEGDPNETVVTEDNITFHWDLFGSAFFMLSRLEEVLLPDRDAHDRFPAAASLAVKEGFERIPVVNAWAEILRGALLHLWPHLKTRTHGYQVLISHDVDWPLVSLNLPLPRVIKASAGDVLVRKSVSTGTRRLMSNLLPERFRSAINPGNTFDYIMRQSELYDLRSAFYFIPENTGGTIDGTYSLDMPFIQALLREIHARGHEIGIHPGYETYTSPHHIQSGFDTLLRCAEGVGIEQTSWGGRQHYLRWSARETWRHWDAAGFTYDSTVGYAETVGFRAGACFDYPVFDVTERRELGLIERPLIVMEGALFGTTSTANMRLSDDEGLRVVSGLADTVQAYGGNFTLLWHNSSLITPQQKRLYSRVLAEISR